MKKISNKIILTMLLFLSINEVFASEKTIAESSSSLNYLSLILIFIAACIIVSGIVLLISYIKKKKNTK